MNFTSHKFLHSHFSWKHELLARTANSHFTPDFLSLYAASELRSLWDFPGSPVVRTLCFCAGGTGLIPGRGTKITKAMKCSQNKQTETKQTKNLRSLSIFYRYSNKRWFFFHTNLYKYIFPNKWCLIKSVNLIIRAPEKFIFKNCPSDFLGGPVVKTPRCSQCRDHGFDPRLGN